ncbi:pyridoxamine 5'-phosphate oxidase family protein [Candidatus Nitrosopumilus salaria BD31]|uniref:Pyridoxamine 5'-phosphate oxidase family protein n=2 Tax=Nitrosopumilus TaxID=338191 RepID=I3CZS2_9ARCH|nr:pyridoxamine 5'-phosphate oxidase family protein [Candidatus Nitrosopumilus salaria BD31]
MLMITQEIKDFLNLHKLAYVATVSSDGKPNLSPKGTLVGWSSNILAFADIRSPDTMNNLQSNSNVEINAIDPFSRRGYLFKGQARILKNDSLFEEILNYYRSQGVKSPINSIVLVDVSDVSEVTSPLYDLGVSEQEIKSKWKKHFENL